MTVNIDKDPSSQRGNAKVLAAFLRKSFSPMLKKALPFYGYRKSNLFATCKSILSYVLQGTMVWEMVNVQDYSNLDAIVTTVSGGGMSAGICIAAKHLNPNIKGKLFIFIITFLLLGNDIKLSRFQSCIDARLQGLQSESGCVLQ